MSLVGARASVSMEPVNLLEGFSENSLDGVNLGIELIHVLGGDHKYTHHTILVLLVPFHGSGVSETDSISTLSSLEVGIAEVVVNFESLHTRRGESDTNGNRGLGSGIGELGSAGDVREEVPCELGLEVMNVGDVEEDKGLHHKPHSDPVDRLVRNWRRAQGIGYKNYMVRPWMLSVSSLMSRAPILRSWSRGRGSWLLRSSESVSKGVWMAQRKPLLTDDDTVGVGLPV